MSAPPACDSSDLALWALIPVKSFERGKSRLSAVLSAPQRIAFARSLLEHVLGVVLACPEIAGTMVVTDGADVADLVQQRGVLVMRDIHPEPLSAIVDRALVELSARGARSGLVLMSDLPLLEASDVRSVVERMRAADVVVVPDFHEEGTNALGVTPPCGLSTCFGMPDSFRRHCDRAEQTGLRVDVVRSRGLMFDVDGPDEWGRLQVGV